MKKPHGCLAHQEPSNAQPYKEKRREKEAKRKVPQISSHSYLSPEMTATRHCYQGKELALEVISKLSRSWARAETPTVAAETPWGPREPESPAADGLQQLPYRNPRTFPIPGLQSSDGLKPGRRRWRWTEEESLGRKAYGLRTGQILYARCFTKYLSLEMRIHPVRYLHIDYCLPTHPLQLLVAVFCMR